MYVRYDGLGCEWLKYLVEEFELHGEYDDDNDDG